MKTKCQQTVLKYFFATIHFNRFAGVIFADKNCVNKNSSVKFTFH